MQEIIEEFYSAMTADGIAPQKGIPAIVADGKWQRFKPVGHKKPTAYYRLTIDGDFAVGNYGDFREGMTHTWTRKSKKRMSAAERKAIADRIERERKQAALRTAKKQARLSKRLGRLVTGLSEAPDSHPYLKRKGVAAYGVLLREKTGEILIPVYDISGKIYSLQRIFKNGDKIFLKGGEVRGGFYPLAERGEIDDKGVIIICEGFATGGSIRAATELPVIVAYNAGNLQPVAEVMRGRYPDAKIIIACDNDQWTVVRGQPQNTGLIKGREAAAAVRGFVCWYDFPADHPKKLTDFNDLHGEQGYSAVLEKFAAVLAADNSGGDESQTPDDLPIIPAAPDFERVPDHIYEIDVLRESSAYEQESRIPVFSQERMADALIWKKDYKIRDGIIVAGELERNNFTNLCVYLRHHQKFASLFRYDKFCHRVYLYRCPPWEDAKTFKIRQVKDTDYLNVMQMLDKEGLFPRKENVKDAVHLVAEENWINPPENYLKSLVWDGQPRLDTWLTYYLGANNQNPEYLKTVGKCWLIGAAARVLKPGCKMDTMLVLEGAEGIRKSTALSIVALDEFSREFAEQSYFCDTVSMQELGKPDTTLKMHGKMIVEFSELEGMSGGSEKLITRWMTNTHDECRKPYGTSPERYPRTFVCAGTTNEAGWMTKRSGNRRFWPVSCGVIDCDALRRDVEQLWAEAVHLLTHVNERWWIEREDGVWKHAVYEQTRRLTEDTWDMIIGYWMEEKKSAPMWRILEECLGIPKERQGRNEIGRASDILRKLGYENKTRDGKRVWMK